MSDNDDEVYDQDAEDIVRMPVAQFRRLGFLQEVNRRVLHPAGLALEIIVNEDGTEQFGGVWDYRNDPEGVAFGENVISEEKIATVDAEIARHAHARIAEFGHVIQPSQANVFKPV